MKDNIKKHSIIIIKNNEGKFLNYYDNRWDCYLFLNSKLSNYDDIKNIKETVFNCLGIMVSNKEIKYYGTITHEKYSIPNKINKIYEHSFYCIDIGNKKINSNYECKWFSLEELEKDKKIMQINKDIIDYIKELTNRKRCIWVNYNNPTYVKYHDEEWGKINTNDKYLFEMLLLETFQAGLSWECILNKRKYFKEAFDDFNYNKISKYNDLKIKELLSNQKIIRNKLKINSAINNAKVFIDIQKEYKSFSNYIWSFTNNKVIYNNVFRTTSPLSDKISEDLTKRGMKFVGSTIIYSYLQAIGVIYDHELNCYLHKN